MKTDSTATPEVLFFGCLDVPGHFLYSKRRRINYEDSPWGTKLDGGLLTDDYARANTQVTQPFIEAHKAGWTAVAFWDRSGDERPGSNSAFLVEADMSAETLLRLSREQWPEVFNRRGFPIPSLPSPPSREPHP
jgi:hypothetical protein